MNAYSDGTCFDLNQVTVAVADKVHILINEIMSNLMVLNARKSR